jgi:hypothetical protein
MRKYISIVINAEAIILPTIAKAACVAVTAADWEADTCSLALLIVEAAAAW